MKKVNLPEGARLRCSGVVLLQWKPNPFPFKLRSAENHPGPSPGTRVPAVASFAFAAAAAVAEGAAWTTSLCRRKTRLVSSE